MDQSTKLCPRCKTIKPWAAFYINRERNRPQAYCKPCQREDFRRRTAKPPKHATHCKRCGGPIEPRRSNRPILFCSRKCQVDWHNWKPGSPEKRRESGRRQRYGVSGEEYERRLAEQNGKCKLCGKPEAQTRHAVLEVDHCHDTGSIRGLLCHYCNWVLGLFGDDPARFRQAVDYLEEHRAADSVVAAGDP